jgi:N-acetylmuramoyl-L-alanine amidase
MNVSPLHVLLLTMLLGVVLPAAPARSATTASSTQPDAAQPGSLTVRSGDQTVTVPLVAHPDGGHALRADLLAQSLGGTLVADGPLRYRLQLGPFALSLTAGSSIAASAEDTFPMTAAAYRLGARLYVPKSVASELLPRASSGLIFDAARNELRRFALVTTAKAPQVAPPPSSARMPASNAVGTLTEPVRLSGRRRVVVVDAGHGGVDPGMSASLGDGRRLLEKQVTLAVARELRDALDRRGIAVVMTRTTDTLIALADRGHIANRAKGDLFLSVHVNAANPRWSKPSTARGFETYFLAEAKTEDEKRVEAMENEVIKFETRADATRDDPLGFIIRDMAQNEHLRESSRLADLIQRGLKSVHPGPDRGVKQAGFRVLVTAFMPAVLIEIGYGTNPSDAGWMTAAARQREMAESIADAAVAYLAEYERKVGGQ